MLFVLAKSSSTSIIIHISGVVPTLIRWRFRGLKNGGQWALGACRRSWTSKLDDGSKFACVFYFFKVFEEYSFHTCQIICDIFFFGIPECVLCLHALMTDVFFVVCSTPYCCLLGSAAQVCPPMASRAGKHIPLNPPTFHAWFKTNTKTKCKTRFITDGLYDNIPYRDKHIILENKLNQGFWFRNVLCIFCS